MDGKLLKKLMEADDLNNVVFKVIFIGERGYDTEFSSGGGMSVLTMYTIARKDIPDENMLDMNDNEAIAKFESLVDDGKIPVISKKEIKVKFDADNDIANEIPGVLYLYPAI